MAGGVGNRGKGRPKGSVNKATEALGRQKDPLVVLSTSRIKEILTGKLPCSVCRGVGRTRYQPAKGGDKLADRTCLSCYGSKYEKISPELMSKVALEVREYGYPKRKAIEVTGEDGGPVEANMTVTFVQPPVQ